MLPSVTQTFPVQNGLNQGDGLSPLLLSFKNTPSGRLKKTAGLELMGYISFWSVLMMLIY
jgi:hypothetical protein